MEQEIRESAGQDGGAKRMDPFMRRETRPTNLWIEGMTVKVRAVRVRVRVRVVDRGHDG